MNTVLFDGLVSGAMLLAMLGCAEIGRRIEQARVRKDPEHAAGETSLADPAVLGLLALLLAFTFGWSATRLDYHRRLIADEANAIGTAYLRLDLLPAEAQPALRDLFRRYLEERIRASSILPRSLSVQPEPVESARLQREIWSRAQAGVRGDWAPAAILLLPAINEMIDVTTRRRLEIYSHVPLQLLLLFVCVALASALLAGRSMAGPRRRNLLQIVVYSLAVAATVFVVLDLEFPRVGLVRLDLAENALVHLRDTMR